MNDSIAAEIQAEQNHGRSKYGKGPNDLEHDDKHELVVWHSCIDDHNFRAYNSTPMDRRQHLIKIAGLAVSAVESFDRKQIQLTETVTQDQKDNLKKAGECLKEVIEEWHNFELTRTKNA